MKIKTIDIEAKEWFDRVNGNSYFSGIVTLNYGLKNRKDIILPYQYGYGNYYIDAAKSTLIDAGYIIPSSSPFQGLSQYCRENNIILRTNKQEGCKKSELLEIVK